MSVSLKSIGGHLRHVWVTTKTCFSAWSDDAATTHAAALSYYTVFSIAPLLLIALAVGSIIFGGDALQGHVNKALSGVLGESGGKAIEGMLQASALQSGSILATVIGVITLTLGATTVFGQLQESLNAIWKVRPKPGRTVATLIHQRLLSFAMILVIAFLLLVSLVLTAVLAAVGEYASSRLPGGAAAWQWVNNGASFLVVAVLFGAIYKILPDVELRWRDVRFGALLTAFLFTLGKFAIGLYLGKSAIATTFGAAGAVVILLAWSYYSSAILLFGAEYARHHALSQGPLRLKAGAEWTVPNAGNPTEKTDDRGLRTSPRPQDSVPAERPPHVARS